LAVSAAKGAKGLVRQPHEFFSDADFVHFAKQNEQNRRLKKIFSGGECRQRVP
jgi:hypothetical protein